MAKSPIEWTDATWNPVTGCDVVSPGCTNCYAMRLAARIEKMNPGLAHYQGLTKPSKGGPVWTGKIGLAPDKTLLAPLRRKKPTTYFVNSMSDLFHESVPDEFIDKVFAVMALAPQHTFQVLTKRSKRMRGYLSPDFVLLRDRWFRAVPAGKWPVSINEAYAAIHALASDEIRAIHRKPAPVWPLQNVRLGVSAERQKEADERIPDLLATPAAIRFLSAEPLLGAVDLTRVPSQFFAPGDEKYFHTALEQGDTHVRIEDGLGTESTDGPEYERLDWVIAGGESGQGARPMHPDWARSLRDQCAAAGVPFFFKQWGNWKVVLDRDNEDPDWRSDYSSLRENNRAIINLAGGMGFHGERVHVVENVGKKAAGRLLDGVEHNGMPQVRP